jgi:general stress protein 26
MAIQNENHKKLNDLIKGIEMAMFTTIGTDGTLASRPMANQDVEFDGDIWFFTLVNTHKVDDLKSNPNVNVSYSNSKNFVSVTGRAELVLARSKIDEYWTDALKVWFPDGKDDPNLALIKIEAKRAEYWTSPNAVVSAIEFVRAFVTNDEYQAGENEKIQL